MGRLQNHWRYPLPRETCPNQNLPVLATRARLSGNAARADLVGQSSSTASGGLNGIQSEQRRGGDIPVWVSPHPSLCRTVLGAHSMAASSPEVILVPVSTHAVLVKQRTMVALSPRACIPWSSLPAHRDPHDDLVPHPCPLPSGQLAFRLQPPPLPKKKVPDSDHNSGSRQFRE